MRDDTIGALLVLAFFAVVEGVCIWYVGFAAGFNYVQTPVGQKGIQAATNK